MIGLTHDLRYAFRGMRRNPLFITVAILSLALGIGANTAIFTLMDQLMLRQLPVEDPDGLVMLYQRGSQEGNNMGSRMHSYPIYQDYQQKAEPLADVLCRRLISTSVSIGNQTERIDAEMVSGNYFTLLGVKAAAGRLFNAEEDERVVEGHPVVVLTYDYWVNRFARDPKVVGTKILVNNYPMTIVGVSAPGFVGLDPVRSPQIRVPILMKPVMIPDWTWFKYDDRRTQWVQVFARLKPGFTAESAEAPMQVLFRQIREYESTLEGAKDWSPYARDRFLEGTIHVEKAATGYSMAIDSVAFDFLWAEWNDYPRMPGADDYLHEAALADNPPSGTFYDPNHATNTARLSSLGVHEHWNNATDRKYSRNLGRQEGIELIASL